LVGIAGSDLSGGLTTAKTWSPFTPPNPDRRSRCSTPKHSEPERSGPGQGGTANLPVAAGYQPAALKGPK
jgi:hypothetical protein